MIFAESKESDMGCSTTKSIKSHHKRILAGTGITRKQLANRIRENRRKVVGARGKLSTFGMK